MGMHGAGSGRRTRRSSSKVLECVAVDFDAEAGSLGWEE